MPSPDLQHEFRRLLEKYLSGTASVEEKSFVEQYYARFDQESVPSLSPLERKALEDRLWNRTGKKAFSRVIPFYRRRVWQVAAVFVIMLSAGLFALLNQGNKEKPMPVSGVAHPGDALPGRDRAMLILADGSTIALDSAANGNLINQGSTRIIKLDGRLAYEKSGSSQESLYNTVRTPRGGQYQLQLADGSKVWLNAGSSLRFPAGFSGSTREVELRGEAYFDVARDPAKPFVVNLPRGGRVEVTGTEFNINSYEDEGPVRTTLLSGRVRVESAGGEQALLTPGQQALQAEALEVKSGIDIEEVTAWKNGWFQFNRLDIGSIMRQVSRWYDLDVAYEGPMSRRSFSGVVSRQQKVSEVMKIFESAGIRFRIEGRRMTVMQ